MLWWCAAFNLYINAQVTRNTIFTWVTVLNTSHIVYAGALIRAWWYSSCSLYLLTRCSDQYLWHSNLVLRGTCSYFPLLWFRYTVRILNKRDHDTWFDWTIESAETALFFTGLNKYVALLRQCHFFSYVVSADALHGWIPYKWDATAQSQIVHESRWKSIHLIVPKGIVME